MNKLTERKKAVFMAIAQEAEHEYMDYLEKVNSKSYLVVPAWKDDADLLSTGECYGWNWQNIPVRLKKKGAKPKRLGFLADEITVFDVIDDMPSERPLLDYIINIRKKIDSE